MASVSIPASLARIITFRISSKVSNPSFSQSFHNSITRSSFLEGRGTALNRQTYSKVLWLNFLFLDSFIYI
jgi:hypothetical protein